MAKHNTRRPLEGVRIIDLTRLAPGPYGTMLLADLGAEVIVVGGGRAGPPVSTFARGKRFITLDLKTADGQDALARLVDDADVLLAALLPVALAIVSFLTFSRRAAGLPASPMP